MFVSHTLQLVPTNVCVWDKFPSRPTLITWSVGNIHNHINWELISVTRLRNVLRTITALMLESCDVMFSESGRTRVHELCMWSPLLSMLMKILDLMN